MVSHKCLCMWCSLSFSHLAVCTIWSRLSWGVICSLTLLHPPFHPVDRSTTALIISQWICPLTRLGMTERWTLCQIYIFIPALTKILLNEEWMTVRNLPYFELLLHARNGVFCIQLQNVCLCPPYPKFICGNPLLTPNVMIFEDRNFREVQG